ncbi:DUF6478 family protein [Marivivens marinus]|uniref:DUF6478 family protein n=1 Tax=Marivivens marinus TaxID=3110173 RepID=UPI003B849898
MGRRNSRLIDRLLHRVMARRWRRAARNAATTDLGGLRKERARARELGAALSQFLHVADSRLALPRIGSSAFPKPPGTDWSWRPQLWRGPLASKGMSGVESKTIIGEEVTLFHDCKISELTLRQLRNTRERDLAPFGLRLDVFRFDGSFLSLVVDLPKDACTGLTRNHLIRLDPIIEWEKPLEIFARLNIQHGPNTEQIVREMPLGESEQMIEFDLAYTKLNEKRVERIWLDLIFEGPEMNQVTIRDLTLSRYPRAAL